MWFGLFWSCLQLIFLIASVAFMFIFVDIIFTYLHKYIYYGIKQISHAQFLFDMHLPILYNCVPVSLVNFKHQSKHCETLSWSHFLKCESLFLSYSRLAWPYKTTLPRDDIYKPFLLSCCCCKSKIKSSSLQLSKFGCGVI